MGQQMSIYFVECDGRDVWNPSSDAARTFHALAEAIARPLGVETGLGPIKSDEVVIDRTRFAAFGSAFAARLLSTSDNSGYHVLAGGVFAVVLGLHFTLGLAYPVSDPRLERY